MDRYQENIENENTNDNAQILSRTQKNQDIYQDVYLNSSVVDLNSLMDSTEETSEEVEEENIVSEEMVEEKSYNINDYIKKAHEKLVDDNARRELNNDEFKEVEQEISSLLAQIDEKENSENIFSELLGDDENTMIKGQFENTSETEDSILKAYKEIIEETKLDSIIGDETITALENKDN